MLRILIVTFLLLPLLVQAKPCDFKPIPLSYAKRFNLYKSEGMYKLQFEKQQPLYLYKGRRIYCGKGGYIQYPLQKMALFSTTYVGFLERIKSINALGFVQTMKYVYSPEVHQRFKKGKIIELGYPARSELIAKYKPQIIIDFPPVGVLPNYIYTVSRLNVPTLFVKEHMEEHPLARAEWIKVFAVLVDRLEVAEKEFKKIVTEYKRVSSHAKQNSRNIALVGKMYSGAWNAPAKKSYLVQFLKDLQVKYLFSDRGEGRQILSFEEVMKEQSKATYWLPQALWKKMSDADKEDRRYKLLSKQLRSHAYSNSRRLSAHGSDYWESGVAYPEKILKDLAKVFYPQTFKNEPFYYYRKLK